MSTSVPKPQPKQSALSKPAYSKLNKIIYGGLVHTSVKYHEYPTILRHFVSFLMFVIALGFTWAVNLSRKILSPLLRGVGNLVTGIVDTFLNILTNKEYYSLIRAYKAQPSNQDAGILNLIDITSYKSRIFWGTEVFDTFPMKDTVASRLKGLDNLYIYTKQDFMNDPGSSKAFTEENIRNSVPVTFAKFKLLTQAFIMSMKPKSTIGKALAIIIVPVKLVLWIPSYFLLAAATLASFILKTASKALEHLSLLLAIPGFIFAIPLYVKDVAKAIHRKVKGKPVVIEGEYDMQGPEIEEDSTSKMFNLGIVPQESQQFSKTAPVLPAKKLWTDAHEPKFEIPELDGFSAAMK